MKRAGTHRDDGEEDVDKDRAAQRLRLRRECAATRSATKTSSSGRRRRVHQGRERVARGIAKEGRRRHRHALSALPDARSARRGGYRSEVAKLCNAAPQLLEKHPADVALGRFLDRFIDYTATKKGMLEALKAVAAQAERRSRRAARCSPTLSSCCSTPASPEASS